MSLNGSSPAAVRGGFDYRVLAEDAPDLTTVVDTGGVFCYVSPSCSRLFGWDRVQLEGRLEFDFVHPDDRASLQAWRARLAGSDMAVLSFRFRCRDGSF